MLYQTTISPFVMACMWIQSENEVQKEQLLDSLFTKHLTGCPDKFLLTEKMFSSSLYTPKKFTLESIGAILQEQPTFWQ